MSGTVSYIDLVTSVSLTYAIAVVVGGLTGYMQAGSMISLYAGMGAGLATLAGHLLCKRNKFNVGLKLLCAVSLALTYVFSKRFMATGAFIPSGFMALNSFTVLLLSLLALRELTVLKTHQQ